MMRSRRPVPWCRGPACPLTRHPVRTSVSTRDLTKGDTASTSDNRTSPERLEDTSIMSRPTREEYRDALAIVRDAIDYGYCNTQFDEHGRFTGHGECPHEPKNHPWIPGAAMAPVMRAVALLEREG